MMNLTFGLFTQVSGSGPLGPLVYFIPSSELNDAYLQQIKVLLSAVKNIVFFH